MSYKYLLFFLLFTVVFNCNNFVFSSEYVPWKKGDSALYVDSFNNAVEVEIDKENESWQRYSNFAGLGPLWVNSNDGDEQVFIWSEEKKRIQLLVDFAEGSGIMNNVEIPPCNIGVVRIASKDDVVTVPAGTFNDVIRLEFEPNCADGGVVSAWFVKSVGFVKWSSSNISGIVSSEMVKGLIRGTTFPQGVIINASFPDHIVAIDQEPPVNKDAPPATVDVNLTIQNNTNRELVYKFNSGQKFEIMLLDENGEIVSLWSRGKAFTEAIEVRTLKSGETWSFGGAIELADDEGNVIPGGNYTIKIEMTTSPDDATDHMSGSERINATSPLTVFLAL